MAADTAALYRAHLDVLQQRSAAALEAAGYDHLLIASGVEKYHFLDDRPYPFQPNPHFKHWLPLIRHPSCWLVITPGKRPLLAYYQPDDYWHLPPTAPQGYWTEHFDIHVISEPEQARALLPQSGRCAIIGEAEAALPGFAPDNSEAVLNPLHFQRGVKTPYEVELMRRASLRAVHGHHAAEAAFRCGESELAIHRAYLEATAHNDLDLPYGNIVGLNEHAAVLHYQYQDAARPAQSRSFLIDAGASEAGYAADITRTYAFERGEFADFVAAVDRVQLALVAQVRAGVDYAAIHLDAHRQLAGVLAEAGVLKVGADEAVARGVSSTFYPHGIGHLIGLQVHDVAGLQLNEQGGVRARPDGHPFLRLTRTLEPGMVVTIEPGLYFIPTLLDKLRATEHADCVDWNTVERFLPFGGVRVEDDVVCTEDAPENLTRDAFAAAGQTGASAWSAPAGAKA